MATAVWAAGEVVRLGGASGLERLTTDLIAAGSTLAGQWCLFMAMSWHARHVVLDASGELRARKKKKKPRAEETPSDEREATPLQRDVAPIVAKKPEAPKQVSSTTPGRPTPPVQQNTTKQPPSSSAETSNLAATLTFGGRPSHTPAQNQQLSKAERKQLKREIRRAA